MFYLYKQAIKVSSWEMDTSKKKTDPVFRIGLSYFFLAGNLPFFFPASGWASMISMVSE